MPSERRRAAGLSPRDGQILHRRSSNAATWVARLSCAYLLGESQVVAPHLALTPRPLAGSQLRFAGNPYAALSSSTANAGPSRGGRKRLPHPGVTPCLRDLIDQEADFEVEEVDLRFLG